MAWLPDFRADLKTKIGAQLVAGGFTLTAARVLLGYQPRMASDDFLDSVDTAGPWLFIGPGVKTSHDEQTNVGSFDIPCKLYFGLPRETADDFSNIETFLEALNDLWTRSALTWSEPEIMLEKDPVIVFYPLTVAATGGC